MAYTLKAICVALALFYLSRKSGRLCLNILRLRAGRGPEAAIIETGAGAWALSPAVLALVAAGLWQKHILWLFIGVAALLFLISDAVAALKNKPANLSEAATAPPTPRPAWAPAAWVMLAAAAAVNLLRCLAPPTNFDALAYHLAVPKIYLARGALRFLPTIPYSNFPLTAEMLFLPALAAGAPEAASLIHAGFGLMTAAFLFFWTRRNFSYSAALVATLVFYLTPLVSLESPSAMIDLIATFYSAAAVMLLAPGKPRDGSPDSAALAALFAGIAVSVKWSCAIVPAIAVALVFFGSIRDRNKVQIRPLRLFQLFALFLAPSLPYLIKNLVLAGNPVWPVLDGVLGGREISSDSAARLIALIRGHGGLGRDAIHLLRLPWDMTMREWAFGGAISQTFLCFVPLYLLVKKNRGANFLLAFSIAYIPLWFLLLNLSLRFFLPALPLLAVIVGCVVTGLPGRGLRAFAGAALALQLCFSLLTAQVGDSGLSNDFRVIFGGETREHYKIRHLPEYELYRWVNRRARPGERILLGETLVKGYYLDAPYYWGHPVFQSRYRYSRMKDGEALYIALRRDGIAYVIFRSPGGARGVDFPLMDARSRNVWRDFMKSHTRKVFSTENGAVYQLVTNARSALECDNSLSLSKSAIHRRRKQGGDESPHSK